MMVNFAKRRYIRPNYTSHKIFPAGTSKQKVFRIISFGAMRKEEGGKRERLAILSWFDPLRLRRKEKESGRRRRRRSLGTIPSEKERKGINTGAEFEEEKEPGSSRYADTAERKERHNISIC